MISVGDKVPVTIEDYQALKASGQNSVDRLAMDDDIDVEFDSPKALPTESTI